MIVSKMKLDSTTTWKERRKVIDAYGNVYVVARRRNSGTWACSCAAFRRYFKCEHVRELRNERKAS